jgi:hypothetical protein
LPRFDEVKHRTGEGEYRKRAYPAGSGPLFTLVYFLESEAEEYR